MRMPKMWLQMGKIKVGVLVFAEKGSLKVGRMDRKNYHFDSFAFQGLNAILSNLKYEYEHCSKATLDNYEHVIVSLISFHDALNLIKNIPVKRKAKVIVGGPACNNIRGYLRYIDVANFGRCDGDKINRIIEGKELPSVWRKSIDPDFSGQYEVDNATKESLLTKESSVGCQQKCKFCLYSWWNGYAGKKKHYTSGFANYEDFFQYLDWDKCRRGGVTGLDGITEETRLRLGKKIKYSDLLETMRRSNKIEYDKKLRLKVYCIAGFPWEKEDELERLDLVRAINETHKSLKNQIVIKMHVSHFIPFQKTPLWAAPFSFHNYRKWCVDHSQVRDWGRVQLYSGGNYTPSLVVAAQSTIIQRAFNQDEKYLRFIANPKFQSLNFLQARRILKRDFAKFFTEQDKETIGNIKTRYKYNGA